MCRCQKGCVTTRCSCYSGGLSCSSSCNCTNCANKSKKRKKPEGGRAKEPNNKKLKSDLKASESESEDESKESESSPKQFSSLNDPLLKNKKTTQKFKGKKESEKEKKKESTSDSRSESSPNWVEKKKTTQKFEGKKESESPHKQVEKKSKSVKQIDKERKSSQTLQPTSIPLLTQTSNTQEVKEWIKARHPKIQKYVVGFDGHKLCSLIAQELYVKDWLAGLPKKIQLHGIAFFDDLQKFLSKSKSKLVVGSAFTEVKGQFGAHNWDFFKEINGLDTTYLESLLEKVRNLKINFQCMMESSMYPSIVDMLQQIVPDIKDFVDVKTNILIYSKPHYNQNPTVPDVVIHNGGTEWTYKDRRSFVLFDLAVKRRFNPEHKWTSNNYKRDWFGDLNEGYIQLVKRSSVCFNEGEKTVYYSAITDFENIIFWKMVYQNNTIEPYFDGPYPLGGKWKQKEKIWHVRFKSEKLETGFARLCALLAFVMKGSTLQFLIRHEDMNTQQYTVLQQIGKGRRSIVFAATDEMEREVCIKLEPIRDCDQITNEVQILKKLAGCKGVPTLLFSGTTQFQGEGYQAVVTDVVGEKNISELQIDIHSMVLLAKQAVDILHGIHKRGIMHNDIKPDHFVIKNNAMYLIDYGCSGPIGIPSKLETPKFASYFGFESEKKDFESLWYSFLSLCMKLPWDKNEIQELEELNLRLKYSPENQLKAFPQIAPIFSELLN
eukprot:TRINITY_DN9877_c0_g1_i3.p1 TRINITY_DN9877_c0_g1~~TRINITY_DN9877_c0_g1_i3.p1  ORF type:complete len:730 (+),score=167.43 TRINITY_DN9877_c0_g1_i3:34-2190(+)